MINKSITEKKLLSIIYQLLSGRSGYTLVELLTATSIIVIISGLIVGILYSTLRGGNKTRITNDVAQNGNFALSIISNTALLSSSVTKVGGVPITDCTTQKSGTSIEFKQSDYSLISFSCDPATQSIASTSANITTYLIDNNAVKVDPATCTFTCLQSNGNPYAQPIISASFTVSQRSTSINSENIATSTFNTSVTMRNYSP